MTERGREEDYEKTQRRKKDKRETAGGKRRVNPGESQVFKRSSFTFGALGGFRKQ